MTENRMEQPVNENKIISLERKELMGVFLRFACFPMVTINYERFQTLQYFSALAPVLKKLYPNKEDQISAAKAPHGVLQHDAGMDGLHARYELRAGRTDRQICRMARNAQRWKNPSIRSRRP